MLIRKFHPPRFHKFFSSLRFRIVFRRTLLSPPPALNTYLPAISTFRPTCLPLCLVLYLLTCHRVSVLKNRPLHIVSPYSSSSFIHFSPPQFIHFPLLHNHPLSISSLHFFSKLSLISSFFFFSINGSTYLPDLSTCSRRFQPTLLLIKLFLSC